MIEIFFDGSCFPNPGNKAKGGYAIYEAGQLVITGDSGLISEPGLTNNCAEYAGLEAALIKAADLFSGREIYVYGDSDMVIRQMRGEWKAKGRKRYYPYYEAAKKAAQRFPVITWEWIPREENTIADKAAEI